MIQQNNAKFSQVALLLCLIIPAGKFMHLPMLLFEQCGRDLWMSYVLGFVVDFLCLLGILWATTLNKENLSINDILTKSLGKIVCKILMVLLALFFFIKFCVILLDLMALCDGTFVIKSNWPVFASLMLVSLFFVLKAGLNSIMRLSQIIFVPVLLSLVAIIALSVGDGDFNFLSPMLYDGINPVFKSIFDGSLLFSDALFIMMAFGDLKYEKHGKRQILLAFGVGSFLTVALSVMYVALFGELSGVGEIAISRVSQFNLSSSAVGRLDWLLIAIWLNAILTHLFTLGFCFNRTLKFLVGEKKSHFNLWIYFFLCIAVVVVPLLIDIKDFILKPPNSWIKITFFVVLTVLTLVLPLLTHFATNKKSQQPPNKVKAMPKKIILEEI